LIALPILPSCLVDRCIMLVLGELKPPGSLLYMYIRIKYLSQGTQSTCDTFSYVCKVPLDDPMVAWSHFFQCTCDHYKYLGLRFTKFILIIHSHILTHYNQIIISYCLNRDWGDCSACRQKFCLKKPS